MYVPVCLKRDVIVGLANEWMPMSVHFSTVSVIYSKVCCFQEVYLHNWNEIHRTQSNL